MFSHRNFLSLRLGSNWRTLLVQQCGPTKVEPFDIPSQQCGNVCDEHDHSKFVFWFLSNILAQQMCVMTFTETDLSQTSNLNRSWTQEAVNMAASCWKLLWGWYVIWFRLMEDQEWVKSNVKSTRASSLPQFEKTSLKSEKKYKNQRQREYHHTLKGRKTLSSAVSGIRTWDLSFIQLSYPSEWKTEKK